MTDVINKLNILNKTISAMESCTGGALMNSFTNINGSSNVFKYGAVTYSNEFKIKMGVSKSVIKEYTVYSNEVANEMSKSISKFTNSNYGVGITGQINCFDINNKVDNNNKVYISVYDRDNDCFYNDVFTCVDDTRENNKKMIVERVINILNNIL